jgi:hypothetical protein
METTKEIVWYKRQLTKDILGTLDSEAKVRGILWNLRYGEQGFSCRRCEGKDFWEHISRAEVRECSACGVQHRVRSGTIFEHSKISLLTWFRALHFVMQDKRGVSALQLKRMLGLKSMATTWLMLMKIRKALGDKDATYHLKGVVELDGAYFIKDPALIAREPYVVNKKKAVLIAVEQKKWVDEKGRQKMRAGFAKVYMDENLSETKESAEKFVRQSIKPRSILKTDGKYKNLAGDVRTDSKAITGDVKAVIEHLPWVHTFISNAKTWILGTHHGRIESKYLKYYLAEYTYRFNRRHDPNSLFHRALSACIQSAPIRQPALCGNA